MRDHDCVACPFAFTEESEMVQNYGCLPTPHEIMSMRIDSGKTWACHKDNTIPCVGAIQMLREYGHPYKVIDKELVTEQSPWNEYIKRNVIQ